MNNKMGYFLIVLGLILAVWGIIIVSKPQQKKEINEINIEQSVKAEVTPKQIEKEKNTQDDFDENKAKGDAFEKFVVKNFDQKYFTLQEWRSDKYVDGIYAVSNHFPDLEVIFNFKEKAIKEAFAIECKWRKNYFKNEIEWAKNYQIKNYKEYAKKLNIPVFVVIGVGGEPEKPNELFIVPLLNLKDNVISKSELEKYKKDISDTRFFWDYEKNKLR